MLPKLKRGGQIDRVMSHLMKPLTFFIAIILAPVIWTREFPECLNVIEPDTFVSSQRSCAKYIFCDGESSFEGECLGGNNFNEAEGICDDPENVKCDIVEGDNVSSIFDDKSQKSDLDENDGDLMGLDEDDDPNDDNEVDELLQEQDRDVSSFAEMSEAAKCSTLSRYAVHHIPHRESCSAFFTCYNGLAIPMLCPRNLYFNGETEKCEELMPTSCMLRYSVRLNCRKGVYDYMPHPQRCEYYHYCLNGFLMMLRCPYDFLWHYERRTCVHKSQAKCYVDSTLVGAQQPVIYRSS